MSQCNGFKRFFICILLTFVMAEIQDVMAKTGAEFFKPAPDLSKGLAENELYPRGRVLTYSLYSVGSPEIEKTKEDGFTAIGPFYGQQNGIIEKAKKLGVKCIYSPGKRINFKDPNYVMPTDENIISQITVDVKAVVSCPEVAMWNLANEELRYWKPDELHLLELATKTIREADPYKRPIMMYDCINRNAATLSKTVKHLDCSSKGMYCNSHGFQDKRIWVRWGVEQEVEAIKEANRDAIPISVLWMAKDPCDSNDVHLIDDWCRHDVYLSLVCGAKGILIWSGKNNRKGFEKNFKDYYDGYALIGRQLNGKLNLSRVFLFGHKRDDIKIRILSGPAELHLDYDKKSHIYPSVAFLDAAYKDERYLIMVNSSNEDIVAEISGLPVERIAAEDVFGLDKRNVVTDGKFSLQIPALGVKGFQFKRINNEEP